MKLSLDRIQTLHGILFIGLMSCAAFCIADSQWVKALSLSPMIIGIILGMLYANSLRSHLPQDWSPGIAFCAKRILRIGIILYGFRLSFQQVYDVGAAAIITDAIIVVSTIAIGMLVGKLLKMDASITLLSSCGSAICGAAAVMGVDGAIQPKPYKTAVSVATVVIFGTLSMFLYPILYRAGIFALPANQMGIFTGSTVHEVAHVVGAGNAMGGEISDIAIIVKMIRVMMLVPVLLLIAYFFPKESSQEGNESKTTKVNIPWFAVLFLVVIGFNSLQLLPESLVSTINNIDTFLLTMAMVALGTETSIDKFKQAGAKPFVLALVLFAWLMGGGYLIAKYLLPLIM